jgi:hypothetical protein
MPDQALKTSVLRNFNCGFKYLEASVKSHLISVSSGSGLIDAYKEVRVRVRG